MRFAIYIPGDGVANVDKLTAVGLSYLRNSAAGIAAPVGPDGQPGVVFSWPTQDPRSYIAYLGESQEWFPAVERDGLPAGRYWVGFDKASPPTPNDLAWADQLEGGPVLMGDGRRWNIPAAGKLPQDCILRSDGRPVEEVQLKYRRFWDQSQKWFDWFMGIDFDNPQVEWDVSVWMYLEEAMSLNYMLTPEVISKLRLINSDSRGRVMLTTFGGMQISEDFETQKKSDPIEALVI